jgi:hypothetical protein
MSDPATLIRELLGKQTEDCSFAELELVGTPDAQGLFPVRIGNVIESMSAADIFAKYQRREDMIHGAQNNHYEDGVWFPAWDRNLWELCRHRVANPGVPIHFLVGGSNGSAKTFFASAVLIRAMMTTKGKMFWCLAIDEPNSETVQQAALYYWLPNEYKTEGGGIQGTARGKLKFNDSGGFTDNRFSLYHGAKMECRFWSKDIKTLEGPRPYAVWSDEEIPLPWIQGIDKRLLTHAEPTRALCPKWKRLLADKDANPDLAFPRELIGELMMGVHLITYTAKDGYTDTVREFQEDGAIMIEIEADPDLLPVFDAQQNIIGGEKVPQLIHSQDPTKRMIFMYAWDNPKGGNWQGMKQKAKGKPRSEILWWCYGVAEKSADSPFPNFNLQVHRRPYKEWLPRIATPYHVADPVASGGRSWFCNWALVLGEQWQGMAPGDIFIAHEYPQENDFIPSMGRVGPWALPGGKNNRGTRGPAQKVWSVGYEWRASEIKRIERKLATDMGLRYAEDEARMKKFVRMGRRIIDPRAGNTATENQTGAKTIIDYMRENGLHYVEPGSEKGSAPGSKRVYPGEQTINAFLYYDKSLAKTDTQTGWIYIDPQQGRGPRLWIADHCTNTLASLKNYPGILSGETESPWKDPIDCIRYLLMMEPRFTAEELFEPSPGWGGYGS